MSVWPPGISDGLSLPCSICHRHPYIDYHATDPSWNLVTRKHGQGNRLGVICIECFIYLLRKYGKDPARCIESIQVPGRSATAVFDRGRVVVWPRQHRASLGAGEGGKA